MSVTSIFPLNTEETDANFDSTLVLYVTLLAVWVAFALSVIAPHAIAPLMAICVVVLLILSRPLADARYTFNTRVAWVTVLLLFWSIICALRGEHVGYSLQQVTVFAFMLAPPLFAGLFARFTPAHRQRFVLTFLWLYLLFVMTLGLSVFKLLPLAMLRGEKALELWPLNRAAVFAVLLAAPAILAIRASVRHPAVLIGLFLLLLAVPVVASDSESAKLGLLVVLVLCPLAFWNLQLMARVVFGGMALLLLLFPFVIRWATQAAMAAGFWRDNDGPLEARALIWSGMSDFVTRAPLFGNGIEYARFAEFLHPGLKTMHNEVHPHSFLMQMWIDLGLVGVVLFLICLHALIFRTRMLAGRGGAANLALIAVSLAIWSVSHGMWQAWYLGMVAFSACIIVAVTSSVEQTAHIATPADHPAGTCAMAPPAPLPCGGVTWLFWPVGLASAVLMLAGFRYWKLGVQGPNIWGAAALLLLASVLAHGMVAQAAGRRMLNRPVAVIAAFTGLSVVLYGFLNYVFAMPIVVPRTALAGGAVLFLVMTWCLSEPAPNRPGQGADNSAH